MLNDTPRFKLSDYKRQDHDGFVMFKALRRGVPALVVVRTVYTMTIAGVRKRALVVLATNELNQVREVNLTEDRRFDKFVHKFLNTQPNMAPATSSESDTE